MGGHEEQVSSTILKRTTPLGHEGHINVMIKGVMIEVRY